MGGAEEPGAREAEDGAGWTDPMEAVTEEGAESDRAVPEEEEEAEADTVAKNENVSRGGVGVRGDRGCVCRG